MGCDGGTIPKRDELVRTKKKPEQVDKDAENAAKWKHCALSQEELKLPIVSCDLGRLYNKDAVIEYLLDKSQGSDVAQHIRNLKDVVVLNLTENPAGTNGEANKGDEYMDHQASRFICPVVGMEMNGKYKFCYLRQCGCVLSERALKQVKSEVCHKCAKPYIPEDVIVLNGTYEEVTELRQRMEEKRAQEKLEKKSKKKKAVSEASTSTSETQPKKTKLENGKSASTSKANVDKPGSKLIKSEISLALGGSIAKDPNRSEAFKSLFTSHPSYKKQEKAHWITYNPLYN